MASVHTKDTIIMVDGTDISSFVSGSEFSRSAASHDTTVYGMDSMRYAVGLLDGTFSIEGFYDDSVGSAQATLAGILGDEAKAIVRRPEGTGAGMPEQTFTGLLTSLDESSPVGDMITFSAEFQISGDVTEADQTTP